MKTRVLALSLLVLVLVVSPIVSVTAAQSTTTPTTAPNANTTTSTANATGNNSTGGNATVNRTTATVEPYGPGYIDNNSAYNPNNSSLGVYGDNPGGSGVVYNALIDAFLAIAGSVVGALFKFIDVLLDIALGMIVKTPAPSWGSGWYQNPGGMWTDQYHSWKTEVQPWALFVVIMSTGIYLALGRRGAGLLPARYERQGTKNLILSWVAALWGWQFVGFFLNIANAVSFGIIQNVTDPSLVAGALKGILLIGLIVVAFANIWVVLLLVSLVGVRYLGVYALSAWIPFFYTLRAVPIRGLGMIGDGISRLWMVLVLMTVPVGIVLNIGFSPMTADVFQQAGLDGLKIVVLQMATSLACLILPYTMFKSSAGKLASVGVIGSAPTAEGMQKSYHRQRDRAGEIKENTRQRVNSARDTHRGLRGAEPVGDGGKAYERGQRVQNFTQTINERATNIRGDSEPTDDRSVAEQMRDARFEALRNQYENND